MSTPRAEFVSADDIEIMPDGFEVDSSGLYWPAHPIAGSLARLARIVRDNKDNPDISVPNYYNSTMFHHGYDEVGAIKVTNPATAEVYVANYGVGRRDIPRPHVDIKKYSPDFVNSDGGQYDIADLNYYPNDDLLDLMMHTVAYPEAFQFEVPERGHTIGLDLPGVPGWGEGDTSDDHYLKHNGLGDDKDFYIEVSGHPSAFGEVAMKAAQTFLDESLRVLQPYENALQAVQPARLV